MHFGRRAQNYTSLPGEDKDQERDSCEVDTGELSQSDGGSLLASCLKCFLAFVLCAALAGRYMWDHQQSVINVRPHAVCRNPSTRSEWRSISLDQRKQYLAAIKCLATKPSRLGLNQSLHDDFAYAHIWFGHDSHDGVSFFAYHRWFLSLYEDALRNGCGYRGNMIYWDWSLDWRDPYRAPVFDEENAFGGQGSQSVRGFRGYCVDVGPLPNHDVSFTESTYGPHCVSREFLTNQTELSAWASTWDPEHIARVLDEEDFPTFLQLVEDGPHVALPKMLHGDFSTQNAPSDPLFMLHHTNLDRLYWEWQRRKPGRRLTEYFGKKTSTDTKQMASLNDRLMYGDLGRSVQVKDVMDTEGGPLCYRY